MAESGMPKLEPFGGSSPCIATAHPSSAINGSSSDETETATESNSPPNLDSDDDMDSRRSHMWSPTLSEAFQVGRYCSSRKRTPRTLTRLMQQHRENERHRHHGLNATIREISRGIPGYDETGKETKIVKLQRIITYIRHMEEHITSLCEELGIALDFKNLFLSPHINDKPSGTETKRPSPKPALTMKSTIDPKALFKLASREEHHAASKRELRPKAQKCARSRIRTPTRKCTPIARACHSAPQPGASWRMQSPTRQKSLEDELNWLECCPLPTPDDESLCSDVFDHMLATFNAQGSQKANSQGTIAVDNLGAVDNITPFHTYARSFTAMKSEGHAVPRASRLLGQTSDDSDGEEPEGLPWSQLIDKSWADPPDEPLPNERYLFNHQPTTSGPQTAAHSGSTQHCARPPFPLSIDEDMQESHYYPDSLTSPAMAQAERKDDVDMEPPPPFLQQNGYSTQHISDGGVYEHLFRIPYEWKFHHITPNTQRRHPLDSILLPPMTANRPAANNKPPRPQRIDHRKTSWMNGFMMYSRMHRRAYIAQNPGVHTSHISKLMGQHWRKLLPEQQAPYKEKARQYIQTHLVPNLPEHLQVEFHMKQEQEALERQGLEYQDMIDQEIEQLSQNDLENQDDIEYLEVETQEVMDNEITVLAPNSVPENHEEQQLAHMSTDSMAFHQQREHVLDDDDMTSKSEQVPGKDLQLSGIPDDESQIVFEGHSQNKTTSDTKSLAEMKPQMKGELADHTDQTIRSKLLGHKEKIIEAEVIRLSEQDMHNNFRRQIDQTIEKDLTSKIEQTVRREPRDHMDATQVNDGAIQPGQSCDLNSPRKA